MQMRWREKAGVLLTIALLCGISMGCSETETNGTNEAAVQYEDLTMLLPEGFSESTTKGLYLHTDYPEEQSNLYIYTTEKDADFLQVMAGGQQEFLENLGAAYRSQYEESPEINMITYQQVTVDGFYAYEIELAYTLKEVTYHQLEYIIDADRTYYVAFSQVGERDWLESFRTCAASIVFTGDASRPFDVSPDQSGSSMEPSGQPSRQENQPEE